jgi:hypothetical protein
MPGDLILSGEPGAEEQRVVRAERDRDAGLKQAAKRHVVRRGRDAHGHVRGRADFQGDLAIGEPAA